MYIMKERMKQEIKPIYNIFLNYGLERWKKYNINTLLIINNECELFT